MGGSKKIWYIWGTQTAFTWIKSSADHVSHQYQELFALVQALPGSASVKLLFVIIWIHAGLVAALVSFFLWR